MPLSNEKKREIIAQFGKDAKDSGSPESQIALLTQRIRDLTEHMKINKKDKHSQRGLINLVAQRRKMMKYLKRKDPQKYVQLIQDLQIRG